MTKKESILDIVNDIVTFLEKKGGITSTPPEKDKKLEQKEDNNYNK